MSGRLALSESGPWVGLRSRCKGPAQEIVQTRGELAGCLPGGTSLSTCRPRPLRALLEHAVSPLSPLWRYALLRIDAE